MKVNNSLVLLHAPLDTTSYNCIDSLIFEHTDRDVLHFKVLTPLVDLLLANFLFQVMFVPHDDDVLEGIFIVVGV